MPKSSEIEGLTKRKLSDVQVRVLKRAPDEFERVIPSQVIGGPNPWTTIDALKLRGLIETKWAGKAALFDDLLWRITDAGRAALSAKAAPS